MINEDPLSELKRGVENWNIWRSNKDIELLDLSHLTFTQWNLAKADFSHINISGSDLVHCQLQESRLQGANLASANLTGANLQNSNLRKSDLSNARMVDTWLQNADFAGANLSNSDLTLADLTETNLAGTNLDHVNFTSATISQTLFFSVDLSNAIGLESFNHLAPSIIDRQTLKKSGRLPIDFLRGCGLSDWEIEYCRLYDDSLTSEEVTDIAYAIVECRTTKPIAICPIFISYSHSDSGFVNYLYEKLQNEGIRCWLDKHDLSAGNIEKQISDVFVQLNPIVIVVLSKNSVESDWVEWEVEKARSLEIGIKRDVLCPIALDSAWKSCRWPVRIRNQLQKYYILDFSNDYPFDKLVNGISRNY